VTDPATTDPEETESEEVPSDATETSEAADGVEAGLDGLDGLDEVDLVEETELEDGQLAYDCAAWAGESRGLLASLLNTAGIAHVWQGTTVTIRDEDEAAVDDLVDEVLAAARPALDPSAARLVYEVGQWPVSLQTELADALTTADIPYEWDEQGDLVVREEDEDLVAAVLDELPEPDDEQISSDDGVAVHELFDSLFMAAAKLAKHPADPSATVSLVDDAEVIVRVALPFGFEPAQWRQLVAAVAVLGEAIEGESASTDVSEPTSDERIAELAAALREHLRQYV
jgi:hypothetical protein